MQTVLDQTLVDVPPGARDGGAAAATGAPAAPSACFHCGEPCRDDRFANEGKVFCCQGCLMVHDLLAASGLGQFYELSRHPGVRIRQSRLPPAQHWAWLDEPSLHQRLLDFTDGKVSRVTFQIPAIHCVACVWLLENLFRLHPGVGQSQVNFPRREAAISFAPAKISLSRLVALLASIGYEPHLTLGELEKTKPDTARHRRWLQVGIAGFAFGNIMLFSLPAYLGLDSLSEPLFKVLFGYLSLALAAPVVIYSASDYWKAAWLSLRQPRLFSALTLDVPIALGLAALYGWSAWQILSGRGAGYLDSLSGLVFFLLCGRVFQQQTHERLAFDRDYKCFFPLSVARQAPAGEQQVPISSLCVGDRVRLRHGELIPADARLLSGPALIDYSFVTGESDPVPREAGEYLYAGGQQVGGAIELETVKPVSQSYLASLWNHEAFRKDRDDNLNTLTNRYGRRFTGIVIAVAVGAALFWLLSGDPSRAIKAFTSVLIVACPCALALAAPFTLGTAQRLLAPMRVFLRNALVIERMAKVDAIVFDKTGTLTAAGGKDVSFIAVGSKSELRNPKSDPAPGLAASERLWVSSVARHSMHPHAVRIGQALDDPEAPQPVSDFHETAGRGLSGRVAGHKVLLGSRAWLESRANTIPELSLPPGSVVYLAIDGRCPGAFVLSNPLRPETAQLLRRLGRRYELALLSGDNAKDRERFRAFFGDEARLRFNQTPLDKLGFVHNLQHAGKKVMMIGDGLNDAGALKQSEVGVAVVEEAGAFSPASDVILEAGQVPRLCQLLEFSRKAAKIVRVSFGISAAYNLVGIGIAAAGALSPIICAVLMPLSSVSVVLFSCGAARFAARRAGLTQ